jgi:hypothetical protein
MKLEVDKSLYDDVINLYRGGLDPIRISRKLDIEIEVVRYCIKHAMKVGDI